MIEIVFNESQCGMLKEAKSLNNNKESKLPYGLIMSLSPSFSKRRKKNVNGGEFEDVICLDLNLDIGEINMGIDSVQRDISLNNYRLYSKFDGPLGLEDIAEKWVERRENFERFANYIAEGRSFRIWCNDMPYALCGLYYICDYLIAYPNAVSCMRLSNQNMKQINELRMRKRWEDFDAEEIRQYLSYEENITPKEMHRHSSKWKKLVQENSNLRANRNGEVISAPQDFYDRFILDNILKFHQDIFQIRDLFGVMLDEAPADINLLWYEFRISKLIDIGVLSVVKKSSDSMYSDWVRFNE